MIRILLVAIAALVTVACGGSVDPEPGAPPAPALNMPGEPLKVYFLGDSITTASKATQGGFRAGLADYCAERGLAVEQVGPFVGNGLQHSANNGNTPLQMLERVRDPRKGLGPDSAFSGVGLVFLFASTNPSGTPAQTAADYGTLLEVTWELASASNPNARIAGTTITPISGSSYPEEVNPLLRAEWARFNVRHPGHEVIQADAHAVFGTFEAANALGWYVDTTHPSDAGYPALTAEWVRAVGSFLPGAEVVP